MSRSKKDGRKGGSHKLHYTCFCDLCNVKKFRRKCSGFEKCGVSFARHNLKNKKKELINEDYNI